MKKYIYTVNSDGQSAPAKLLGLVGSGKRVLEVGCASGVQTKILKEQHGCTITGIEIDVVAAEAAAKYCDSIVVGDLETLDLDKSIGLQRFDVITIADVLEHLRNPGRVLGNLKKYLNADGFILASIPNVVHAGLILEMANGRFDYRPYGLLDDTHLRFFTLKSVMRLFEECGLQVKSLDRVLQTVEESEFCQHPLSSAESAILEYVQLNNPEWKTYQFIVKATPVAQSLITASHTELELQDKLHDLELTNQGMAQQLRALNGKITWLESRSGYKAYKRLKNLFS